MRNSGAAAILVLFLLLFAWGCASEVSRAPAVTASGAASGYNVLLITLDTTRADRLGCYGASGDPTPRLDALAKRGVRFEHAITVAPITLPSHSTILTGLYPPNHGVRDNGEFPLDPSHATLAELLGAQGYDTAAFVSAFVLDGRFGLRQGFDHYDDRVGPPAGLAQSVEDRSASEVTDAAVSWLAGRGGPDRPFFAWVHYFDPHIPYAAPEPFRSRFAREPYTAEIAYMDSEVDRLMRAVEDQGLSDRTLVVVVADHGESLGEHGESTHAMFVYESTMRVPLIVSNPGLFGGGPRVDASLVSVVDIFPTVLELVGAPEIPEHDGRSLFDPTPAPQRQVYIETLAPYLDHGWSGLFGLRDGEHKLILAPRPEFYDLVGDPQEATNLYDDPPPSARRALKKMESDLGEMLAAWPDAETVAAGAQPLDRQAMEKLESLGYVGGVSRSRERRLEDPKEMVPLIEEIDRAQAMAGEGQVAEAIRLLQRVDARSPDNPTVLARMALLLAIQGRGEDAERTLRRQLAIRPTARSQVLLAQFLLDRREVEEAESLLAQAIESDPENSVAIVALGDLAAERKEWGKARELYLRARRVDPVQTKAMVDLRLSVLDRLTAGGGS